MARRRYKSSLREQQARDTRLRILEGAARITALDVRLLTPASVARAAGVAERTVYRHFPTVAELHEAFGQFQEKRLGFAEKDYEMGELPAMFERWPERVAGTGALEAMLALPELELLLTQRRRRYAELERAIGRLVPDATRTQRRQLTLVFGALMSAQQFRHGKQCLNLDPEAVVPGPVWAMRVLIETLREGGRPWK
jgi:AcrR family transcriptional regulator